MQPLLSSSLSLSLPVSLHVPVVSPWPRLIFRLWSLSLLVTVALLQTTKIYESCGADFGTQPEAATIPFLFLFYSTFHNLSFFLVRRAYYYY